MMYSAPRTFKSMLDTSFPAVSTLSGVQSVHQHRSLQRPTNKKDHSRKSEKSSKLLDITSIRFKDVTFLECGHQMVSQPYVWSCFFPVTGNHGLMLHSPAPLCHKHDIRCARRCHRCCCQYCSCRRRQSAKSRD